MTFTTTLRNISKRMWAMLALTTAVIAVPASLLAWGPERPTYTMAKPADHITFNSITDATNYGDERNFVRISKDNQTYSDDITVANGEEYYVRLYVHNNASSNLNLVAENVVAKLNVPSQMSTRIQVDGYVNSSNATPTSVWDQAVFNGANGTPFKLSYVAGSAYYKNAKGQFTIADSIVNGGASLGYDKMDGKIPGCFQYSGVVYLKVKAQTADFAVSKTVRKSGADTFAESVAVNPGEKVDYQLYFKNTGGVNQTTVSIKDILPAGMTYVAGTTRVRDALGIRNVGDGITTGGMSVGNFSANGDVYIMFSALAPAKDKLAACGVNKLVNTMSATTAETGTKTDTATVTVTKECDTPKPVKVEACNLDTKKVETVDQSKIDNVHYTKDVTKCAEQPAPKEITVCRLEDKTYPVTINESEFDSDTYSKDTNDCKETPATTVTELPHTGIANGIMSLVGLGSLIGVMTAYIASRRTINQ